MPSALKKICREIIEPKPMRFRPGHSSADQIFILLAPPTGKRPRGRPRASWHGYISDLLGPVLVWSQKNHLKLLAWLYHGYIQLAWLYLRLAWSRLGVEPMKLSEYAKNREVFRALLAGMLLLRVCPEGK